MRVLIQSLPSVEDAADRLRGRIIVYVSLVGAAIPRTNQFLSQLRNNRTWTLQVPDFEIFDARRRSEPKPESPIKLVPQYDSVLSTAVYSDASNDPNEDSRFAPGAVTVRRDIVVREKNRGR